MEEPNDGFVPEPYHAPTPPEINLPDPKPAPQQCRNVKVEEVDNVDDPHKKTRWVQLYPGKVVTPVERQKTQFETWKESQVDEDKSEWAPFDSQEEWELAQWLMKNVGQKSINEYLKLPIVSFMFHIQVNIATDCVIQIQECSHLSFHNTYLFLKKIDQLPTGPNWICHMVEVIGNHKDSDGAKIVEEVELWQ
jgi:hypothetical protein